jgi:hypothetical protein
MVIVPFRVPVVLGVNFTLIVQLPLGATGWLTMHVPLPAAA